MSYDADRAAFIAAITIAEAEDAMALEPKHSRRYVKWSKLHAAAMEVIACYDNRINKRDIYDHASKMIDVLNREMAA